MRPRSVSLLALAAVFSATVQADTVKRVGQPALSPDGKYIAFSWQGDIWKVSVKGGRAERLTVHPAVDTAPVWAPSGKSVVFSSDRFGMLNLYSMSVDGENVRRLTFDSGGQVASSISPDGQYIFGSTAAFNAGRANLFRVPITGGNLTRLTMDSMEGSFTPVVSPDGKSILYGRGSYAATQGWKKPGVKGTAMPKLWVAKNTVPLSDQEQLVGGEEAVIYPRLATNGMLYYVSNRSGWPNIWRSNSSGKNAEQLTFHKDGTINSLSISADGSTAAYVFESELYVLNTGKSTTSKLSVETPEDMRRNATEDLNLTTGAENFVVSPDGKRAILELRGDLFLLPEKGGTTRRLTTNPRMDNQATWLDNKTILYTAAGEGGKREIRSLTLDKQSKAFATGPEDFMYATVSPDGKKVAYLKGEEEIVVVGTAAGSQPTVILKGSYHDAFQERVPFSWGPDSKHIVIDHPTDRASSEIIVCDTGTAKKWIVARTARGAGSTPKFLPNGKGVYFLSNEYPDEQDLFVVDFSPAEPTYTEDDLDKVDEGGPRRRGSAGAAEGAAPAPKPEVKIEIVEEGIENRMRRLTRGNVDSEPAASPDGKTIYASVNGQLSTVGVDGGPIVPVASVTQRVAGPTFFGSKLYFGSGGKIYTFNAERGAVPVSFNAQYTINPRAEELALFEEIGWLLDRHYYDPKLHGKDWNAIREKFSKIVPFVQDRQDFYALMGEMMEELDSSHLGSTPPAADPFGTDSTASLGVDFDPKALDARGSFYVTRVLTGSAAANPASRLMVGDRLLSIDDTPLDAEHPYATLLNKKAGKKVVLKVDRDGKMIDITIKPDSQGARREQEYQNWITWQRKQTEALSGGKLTYMHIRAMDDASFQQFLREIRTLTVGRKGVLIDVRYNGGGSTSHKVLGVLIKQNWLVRTTRGYEGLRLSENIYRGDSLELPTALLFNSYSFSNAEIMGEGFKRLKRGPTIGERTPGYVIGTGAQTLWDGGSIRMPRIGSFTVTGENLENNGRKPEFNVPYDPNAWANGRDVQLEKAVQELLKLLEG